MLNKIQERLGENLVSLFRYRKLAGEFLVIVLKKVDYQALYSCREPLKKQNPIIMSAADFSQGQDVFPLEFLDMQSAYEQISGADLLATIKINRQNLRAQLERELRSKSIHLKDQFLLAREKEFLGKILPALEPLIKGLLYYKNASFSPQIDNNLSKLQEVYKINADILQKLAAESGGKSVHTANYLDRIADLDQLLETLIQKIN